MAVRGPDLRFVLGTRLLATFAAAIWHRCRQRLGDGDDHLPQPTLGRVDPSPTPRGTGLCRAGGRCTAHRVAGAGRQCHGPKLRDVMADLCGRCTDHAVGYFADAAHARCAAFTLCHCSAQCPYARHLTFGRHLWAVWFGLHHPGNVFVTDGQCSLSGPMAG